MNEQAEVFLTGALSREDLDACVALIKEGGAITDPETAAESLPGCLFVVLQRDGKKVVGVGAIKGQRPRYVAGIARKAQFMFDQNTHELGYVVVKNSHQGNGLSKIITDKLLSLFQGRPLFATTSNERMRTSLGKRGFVQQGTSWPNRKGEPITLWIRPSGLSPIASLARQGVVVLLLDQRAVGPQRAAGRAPPARPHSH